MNARTGRELTGLGHLKQSIADILTTPIGSRIMRREYGSRLFELVDRPMGPGFAIDLYAATAEALQRWENRFKLERVQIADIKEGHITLILEGVYLPDGKPITLEGIVVS
jgi:phage baseplate assembly protein W